MVQAFPFEYRIIDFLQNSREPLSWYLKQLQDRPYLYGTDYLPHDARAHTLGTGKSIEDLMRAAGRRVQIVPMLTIESGINMARTIFPQCWFDGDRCADGIQALRRYVWGELATGGATRLPKHDENSHAADAWRMFAVGIQPPKPQQQEAGRPRPPAGKYSWMG
jgi:phage terminase large subunit